MQHTDFFIEMKDDAINTLALLSTSNPSLQAAQGERLKSLLSKCFPNDEEVLRWRNASPAADAMLVKILTLEHLTGSNAHDTRPLKNDALAVLNPVLKEAARDDFGSLSHLISSKATLARSQEYWEFVRRAASTRYASVGNDELWAQQLIASLDNTRD
jgi:hypothetical protein